MISLKTAYANAGSYVIVLTLLAVVVTTAWCQRRFPDVIVAKTVPIHGLTLPQRYNIQQAALRLNGTIIAPNEQFSFNQTVGPRTGERGYLPAPSYVGSRTEATTGGGICVLSSIVYQLALESGLRIDKRTPHLRTTKTIYPGLDATVWYGRADLAFTNTTNSPLEIRTISDGTTVRLELAGKRACVPVCAIQRRQALANKDIICVDITRKIGSIQEVVSHDTYRLSQHSPTSVED